ncbi:MAG: ribonuclease R [Spirochaetia bacterium]|nr:ribonuclease R [Spirochaetia bacterium]
MYIKVKKLLSLLEQISGSTISKDDLLDALISEGSFLKDKNGINIKRKADKILITEELDGVLEELQNFGLLSIGKKNKISVKSPFFVTSAISVASDGRAFSTIPAANDIVIYPENRGKARHNDKVFIKLFDKKRDRFDGMIKEVLTSFQTKFIAKVIAKKSDGYLIYLIDTPDTAFGVIKAKRDLSLLSYAVVEGTGSYQRSGIPLDAFKKTNLPSKNYREYSSVKDIEVFRFLDICSSEDLSSDIKRIALKYNLPEKYPAEVIPAKNTVKEIYKKELKNKKRKNLSSLYTITIDGEDAKDFDDAISIEEKNGKYKAYVHIADVSFFVKKDSPLDEEALSRGNSYYMVNTVFPMLPKILSEDYCSLKPKTKRLCFTCEMTISKNGVIEDYDFYKSLVFINKRFTYNEAEKDLERKKSSLKIFWQIAEALLKQRLNAGRVDLNIPEQEPVTDAHGRMTGVLTKERLKSHRLIEEYMLSANICAAKFSSENNIPILHRNHEPIPVDNLEKINEFLRLYGYKKILKSSATQEVKTILKEVENTGEESVFNYLLLRCFCKAEYSNKDIGHWALGFDHYTHFTSPIRRFSDLHLHRQMAAFIAREKPPYSEGETMAVAKEVNRLEKLAMDAERAMIQLLGVRFFHDQEGKDFFAYLTGFNSYGLFIQLQQPRLEGFIPAEKFNRNNEVVSLDNFRVVLNSFQKTVSLGCHIKVTLEKADWEKMRLVFDIKEII